VALPALVALALAIALALLLGALLWLKRKPRALELAGAALLAYPAASALVNAAQVSDRLTRYTVLLPALPEEFVRAIVHDASYGVLLPLAGALLLWRSRAGASQVRSLADVRDALARVLEPAGMHLRAAPRRALLDAAALLGLTLLLQALALLAEATVAHALVTGDESAYWINLTWPLVLGLSFAAGASEEFVWRGAVLRGLLRRVSWPAAVAVRALLFGFIHAGYGDWAHVLGPALFGALMGLVALRVGLLAAVVVHAGIDVMYLALAAPTLASQGLVVTAALVLLGLGALAATRGAAVRAVLEPLLDPLRARLRPAPR
jgi:membrane protease YdiL (CAAX protease family)